MKTLLCAVCLMFCLAFGLRAYPAYAQDAGAQDLYNASRARYLNSLTNVATVHIDQRRAAYLNQVRNNASFWWGIWEQHQPYSKDIHFTVNPAYTDIPVQPGLANDSPYGHDVAKMTYGKANPGVGRTAVSVLPPAAHNNGSDDQAFNPFSTGDRYMDNLAGGQIQPTPLGQ